MDKIPDTWDDFEKVLGEVKKAMASEQVIPFAMRKEFYRTLGTSFVTRKQQIWDDKGVFQLDAPEFYDTINMYNRWFKNGLITTDSFIPAGDTSIWDKGKVFAGIDSHSWIRGAKKVWGNQNVAACCRRRPPRPTSRAPGCTSIPASRSWAARTRKRASTGC